MADHFLAVRRLLHASSHPGVIRRNPSSKVLADLIGQDARGEWHIVEAKARQSVRDAARASWKAQAASILSINGRAPASQSYTLARIAPRLRAELVDPPPGESPGIELLVDEGEFLDVYYRPIRRWTQERPTQIVRDGRLFLVRIAAYDAEDSEYVWVGLDAMLSGIERNTLSDSRDADLDDAYIGTDGIVVATSREGQIQG